MESDGQTHARTHARTHACTHGRTMLVVKSLSRLKNCKNCKTHFDLLSMMSHYDKNIFVDIYLKGVWLVLDIFLFWQIEIHRYSNLMK